MNITLQGSRYIDPSSEVCPAMTSTSWLNSLRFLKLKGSSGNMPPTPSTVGAQPKLMAPS